MTFTYYEPPIIFPTLKGTQWAKMSLNYFAKKEFGHLAGTNPLNDPLFCSKWIDNIAKTFESDHIFGGYMEDRTSLWRGSYLPPEKSKHLGIDYIVSPGTPVAAPLKCEVIFTCQDDDQNGGWGGFIDFKIIYQDDRVMPNATLLYAHLEHDSLPEIGTVFNAGDTVARIGSMNENGGWFPHLHVQGHFGDFQPEKFRELDGYGTIDECCPNPNRWIPEIPMV